MSSVCRICLTGKVKMQSNISSELQQLYEKLANTKLNKEDGRPKTLCYICYAQLLRCQKFSAMAQRSDRLLTDLISKRIEVTHSTTAALNLPLQRLKVHLQPPLIPLFSDDVYIDEPPKREITSATPVIVPLKSVTIPEIVTREFSVKIEPMSDSDREDENQIGEDSYNSSLNESKDSQDREHTKTDASDNGSHGSMEQKRVFRPKTIGCRICGRKFAKQDNLNKHFKTHPGMKPYLCDHCDDSFYHKKDLQTHNRVAHAGNLGHVCKTCGKSFSHKGMFERHMLTHFGIKPYLCNTCDKQFSLKNNMLRHIRTHTGEKPFVCDTCDRRFAEKKSLEAHISLHHMKDKEFACDRCGKSFDFSRDLKLHSITMHGGRTPFACNLCDSIFSLKQTLKSHMRTHTGEKPYSCDICHKNFTQSSSLSKHKKIHKRQVEIEIENVYLRVKKAEQDIDVRNEQDVLGIKTEESNSEVIAVKQEPLI